MGTRRTSTSSKPNSRILISVPNSAAWSGIQPVQHPPLRLDADL
jgi:hypothetical protein